MAIYSSCFQQLGKEGVLEILSYFDVVPNAPLKRFDICADFPFSVNTILSKFTLWREKWAIFLGKDGNIETRYIWQSQNTKNKRQLIRIYDKIADIIAKGKNRFYHDYLILGTVTRVEVEVRRELTKHYSIEELFVDENLWGILEYCTGKYTDIFKDLEIDDLALYRTPKEMPFEEIQAHGAWLMRVRIFLGHARGLLERWLDPIYALLDKGVIHPTTYEILNESWNFLQIMRSIKRRKKDWKEIMSAIKDKTYDSD